MQKIILRTIPLLLLPWGQVKARGETSKAVPAGLAARRHGLTAKTGRQSGEVLAFTPVYEDYCAEYRPRNRQERGLVEMLAQIRWQLNRVLSVESSVLFPEGTTTPDGAMEAARRTLDNTRQLANISLYEQRLHRRFRLIELDLRELQLHRRQKDRQRHRKIAETPSENKAVASKFEQTEPSGKMPRFFDGSFVLPSDFRRARLESDEARNVPKIPAVHPARQSGTGQSTPLCARAGAFGIDAFLE